MLRRSAVDDLDIRHAEVLMWLPMIWYSRMLEAHAAFLEQLIEDSSTPSVEVRPRKTVIFAPERDIECSTSSLQ
jgi:hypothetical protein